MNANTTDNGHLITRNKHIELHHYAMFREARGTGRETLDTAAATPRELFAEIGLDEAVALGIPQLRVAVNDRVTSWDEPLQDGDRVVFLAPMAGG